MSADIDRGGKRKVSYFYDLLQNEVIFDCENKVRTSESIIPISKDDAEMSIDETEWETIMLDVPDGNNYNEEFRKRRQELKVLKLN